MPRRSAKVLVKPQERSLRRLPPLLRPCAKPLVKRSEKCAMTKVGVVSDVVEEPLERFSAVVSDVCACLMGFKRE